MSDNYCTRCDARLEPDERFCRSCGAPRDPVRRQTPRPRQNARQFFTPATVGLLIGVILFVAAALMSTLNRPEPTPVITVPDSHDEAGIPSPEVERIALDQAEKRYDAGTAIFVDVRDLAAYEAAHIPNAISMPLGEITTRYQELPQDAEIITYCT